MNKKIYPGKGAFIILGSVIIVLFVVTGQVIHYYHRSADNAGAMGDAFNGLTAPIITLISAGLIFYSFLAQIEANKAQIESNKLIQNQWQFDTFYKMYNEIDAKFSNLSLTETNTNINGTRTKTYRGIGWVVYMMDNLPNYDEDHQEGMLNDLAFILNDISQYIRFVKDSEIPQKDYFFDRMNDYYAHTIEDCVKDLYSTVKDLEYNKVFIYAYNRLEKNMSWLRSRSDYPDSYELE